MYRIFSHQGKFTFMSSPDSYAYAFSCLVSHLLLLSFQSLFTSPPFHSVRAVEPWIDISLFALFVLCYCPCSILLLLAIVPFRFQGK